MTLRDIQFLVVGIVIPLLIALIGKEPLGKWLTSGYKREETALSAIIELVRESVAGWRESTSSIALLIAAVEKHDIGSLTRDNAMQKLLEKQWTRLQGVEDRVSLLVTILAEGSEGGR
jgi:hypothetical protein